MSEFPQPPWRSDDVPVSGAGRGMEHRADSIRVEAGDSWRFALIVEIGNFITLRRLIGAANMPALLSDVASRLARLLPAALPSIVGHDTLELRFTGQNRERLDEAVAHIAAAFERPIDWQNNVYLLDIVLGGARCDGPEQDEVRLIEEAERAVREARIERAPVLRDVVRGAGTVDRVALARDLTHAIERDELFLQYQPKVHLRQQEVRSVEALVRWKHPTRGFVMPGDFIPIAEESRDIIALSLWTLRRAILDQRLLAAAGHDLTVFINISGVLLSDARFVREACALVSGGGARIGFEITETAVIRDPDGAIANLKTFTGLGVPLAIDDYGAGLSSLAYLKKLPARELKIDKLFITQLTSSNRDPLIVRSTIDLAHALDMEVVAEGVETSAAMALLSVMGCDMAQGFLISRPIGLDALTHFLSSKQHLGIAQSFKPPFKQLSSVAKIA